MLHMLRLLQLSEADDFHMIRVIQLSQSRYGRQETRVLPTSAGHGQLLTVLTRYLLQH